MPNKIKIAIDAMGGEKSPKKIIDGIDISLKDNTDSFFYLCPQSISGLKFFFKLSLE